MMDPYTLASMIKNKTEEGRIMKLVMDIMETDLICDMSVELNRERIEELRRIGEYKLADVVEKEWRCHDRT